jgi:chromate transporter
VTTIKKDAKFYFKLFLSTFTISAFTFGGGYVIVPLMRKKFVEKLKWIDEKEMLDYVAIAQSSPGPIAVNTSILVGYKLAGIMGALVTVFGTVFPPLIIISVIFYLYASFRDNPVVNAAMLGMHIGVAAVLIDVVITLVKSIIKEKSILAIMIMALSFTAVYFLKIHILIVLAASAVIGICATLIKSKKEGGAAK